MTESLLRTQYQSCSDTILLSIALIRPPLGISYQIPLSYVENLWSQAQHLEPKVRSQCMDIREARATDVFFQIPLPQSPSSLVAKVEF
jgi:hypothetical protein